MSDYLAEAEEKIKFREKRKNDFSNIFMTRGSSGRNNEKLARILSAFDFSMKLLNWQNKPLANLSDFITQYQASIDAKYHNDLKDILIAEEIERKRSERKGISVLQS